MWIHSTLTKGQRVQAYSCSFKVITGGLTQDVATNRMFDLGLLLFDGLGIEKVITLFLVPGKEVFCLSPPLWFGVYKAFEK